MPEPTPPAAPELWPTVQAVWDLRYRDLDSAMAQAAHWVQAWAPAPGQAPPPVWWWMRGLRLDMKGIQGSTDADVQAIDEVLTHFQRAGDAAGCAYAEIMACSLRWSAGRMEEAWARAQARGVSRPLDAAAPALAFSGWTALLCVAMGGKALDAALQFGFRAAAVARQHRDRTRLALANNNLAFLHFNHGNYPAALAGFQESLQVARDLGLTPRYKTTLPSVVVCQLAQGRLADALTTAQEWLARFRDTPLDPFILYGWLVAVHTVAQVPSRLHEADAMLCEVEQRVAPVLASEAGPGYRHRRLLLAWARAHIDRQRGQPASALAALEAGDPWIEDCDLLWVQCEVQHERLLCLQALERWREATDAAVAWAQRQQALLSGASQARFAALAVERQVAAERDARERAETADRLKTEFLVNMSHEIRTPMNAVIGLTELLLQTPLNDTQRSHLHKIDLAGQGLLRVINDMLDLSKIEAGKFELDRAPTLLRAVGEQVLGVIDTAAREAQVRLVFDLDAALPEVLQADGPRLAQVLINLAANAVRSTPPGGTVTLSIGPTPGHRRTDAGCPVRLTVRDTGVGLTVAQQARLFQPFTQVEGTTLRPTEGTGLGLSICQQLVRAMGSEIQVDSEPGRGSTFWFDLALAVDAAARPTQVDAATEQPAAAAPGAAAIARPVLLVEDNPVNLEIARAMLEQIGCTVHAVTDGQQAVQAVQAHPPGHFALVLMDLQMPVMDGHEAAAALRQDRRHDALPIVALTAHALTDVRDRCLAGGMQDYLVKPVRTETLAAAVLRWSAAGAGASLSPSQAAR